MADPMINNNAANLIVNEAYKQFTGTDACDTIDLADIVETGAAYATISAAKEQFTKALIGACVRNWFTDEKYSNSYKDPFFQDSRRFGNIVQMISIQAPTVQESHAWRSFVSGTSTAGSYTLYLPIVDTKYYGKTVSWELPIAVSDEQLDDAFRSADELQSFIDYIMVAVDNAVTQHREDMNALNRNNFIAEKITYAESLTAEGIHKINLVDRYHTERGGTIATASAFRGEADCMRYAAKTISLFAEYMQKQTGLFNTAGAVKFTPKNRLILQINSAFNADLEEVALSNTFHDDMMALPLFEKVPFWQSLAGDGTNTNPGDFDAATAIDIKDASGDTVTRSGIVAFMAHQWAIMHTIRRERVAFTRFDPEAVNQYYYQFRDQYMNNLAMPAIVFTIEDITI